MKLRYMKSFESKSKAQKIRWNSPKVSPAASVKIGTSFCYSKPWHTLDFQLMLIF